MHISEPQIPARELNKWKAVCRMLANALQSGDEASKKEALKALAEIQ